MEMTVNGRAATADRLMMALAAVLGAGSVGLFAWDTRPTFVPLMWPPRVALAWDAFLSLVFFVQHSGMVRRSFRARLAGVIPARYDGAFYAICSGLTLALVVVFWQRVDISVFRLEGAARWIATAGSLTAVALLLYSGYAVRRTLDLLGLRPIRAHMRGETPRSTPFFVDGPYRWVRHPLYACILALFWIRPEMMADGLLLSILWSGWMVVGTVLEERDLVADFGDVYRRYQHQVPMLIPWRGPVSVRAATAILLLLTAGSSWAQTPGRPPQPLNVVLLILDDVRWDALGAAGNTAVRTPRLDQLAEEGIRFEQARVTTAVCMVSRATLLTGQYMSRHGITEFGRAIAPEAFAQTYPGLLRRAGYWVGYVGKYGVGQPRQGDFDFLRAYEGTHWIAGPGGERIHVTEKNARDAIEFLQARPRDKSFALTVGFFAPHAEDNAPEQYLPQDWSARLYDGVTIPPPLRGDPAYLAALPPFLSNEANEGRVRYHWRFDTPDRYQAYMTRYYRLITEVDEAIGRIVGELRAQGVYETTLFAVVGDNGYFQADRGLADKWYPYEESIRVPLVVRDPRLAPARRGMTRGQFALNLDVAPTLVAAAGLAAPAAMQGRDLSLLYLSARAPDWRDEFFYEHPTVTSKSRIPSSQGVVRRDWKYIEWPEFGFQQLFDLRNDPGEIRNLAGQPAHAGQALRMRQQLEEWRRRAR